MKQSLRIENLDVMRGFAALFVVFYHYTGRYDEIYGHTELIKGISFNIGYLGVDLFFVISGFVIFLTIKPEIKLCEFAKKRALRLYPAYWISLCITMLAVVFFGLPGREVTWEDFFVNFTMVQGALGYAHVDGAYWSLQIEIAFYFMCGVYILYSKLAKSNPVVFLYIWMSIVFFVNGANFFKVEDHFIIILINKIVIPKFAIFFQSGILFYLVYLKLISPRKFFGVFTLAILSNFMVTFNLVKLFEIIGINMFFLIGVFWMKFIKWPRIFVELGNLSYPLYLVHQNIGYIIIRYGYEINNPYVGLVLALLICVSISYIIANYAEDYVKSGINKYIPSCTHLGKNSVYKIKT